MEALFQAWPVLLSLFGGVVYLERRLIKIEILFKAHTEEHPCEAKGWSGVGGIKAGS